MNSEEKVRVTLQGLAILLFISFVGAAIVILVLPMEQRLFAQTIVSMLAAISCGSFIVKKLAKDVKERIIGFSTFSMVPPFLLIIYLFFIFEKESSLHLSEKEFLTLFFLTLLPITFATGSLTFEILSHYYNENGGFKLKRFCKHIFFILTFSAVFVLTYNILYILLSPILIGRYILVLNGVVSPLTFYALVKKFGRFKSLLLN